MALSLDLAPGHYAVVCNLAGHYAMGMHQDFNVVPAGSTPIEVGLGETDPTHMFIDLSQAYAPEGKVTFIITNQGQEDHEFVVLATDTPAADFPITGFEGEPNRFDEDAKGLTNVGETGDPAMAPGTSLMLTIDMSAGPLRRGLQPGRPLRDGDAPGLQRGAGRFDADRRSAWARPIPPTCSSTCPRPTPPRARSRSSSPTRGRRTTSSWSLPPTPPPRTSRSPGSRASPTGSTRTPRA